MRYDLVFEGGGARGLIFVGAMQEFEARGLRFGRLLGTSAGAITAALLAAGYSAGELAAAVGQSVDGEPVFQTFLGAPAPFTKEEIEASGTRALFRDLDIPLVPGFVEDRLDEAMVQALLRFPAHRNLMAFLERGGWYGSEAFLAWLAQRLDMGSFRGQPRRFGAATLLAFHEATGVDLSMVAADTTEGRLRVLNHRTAPHCPLVWAVRMSMNIPFLWEEVLWREEWGPYLGRSIAGHMMVDGGVLSGFPIELFLSGEPYVTALMGPRGDNRVLGLLIDETLPIQEEPASPAPLPGSLALSSLRALHRLSRLISTMMTARDRMVTDAFKQLVARLPAQGYGTIEFGMSPARRDRLIRSGQAALRAYLDSPPVLETPMPVEAAQELQLLADQAALRLLQP